MTDNKSSNQGFADLTDEDMEDINTQDKLTQEDYMNKHKSDGNTS